MAAGRRVVSATLAACAALAVVAVPQARAASPGTNGLISWSRIYLLQDSEIVGLSPDGTRHHPVVHNTQNDFDPAWAPGGRRIAYASSSATDVDIWVARGDGTEQTNITNDPGGPDLGPSWSPNGSRIAFWKQNFDGTGSIWVMDADGSNAVALTDDVATNSQPAWSPDGGWIAFSSSRDGNLELYLIHPDGTGLTRLTTTPQDHEENPDWSPDGRWIAFDACTASSFPCPGSANYDIFAIRPDGSGRHQLTTDPTIDAAPAWAPDGTQIVFRADRAATGTELWLMDADGSNPRQLTFQPFGGGVDPDWQRAP